MGMETVRCTAGRAGDDLITDASQLTEARLTTMLTRNGMLTRGHVRQVRLEKWKSQQVSYLYKVTVDYSPDADPELPADLILKFTKPHKPSRRSATLSRREHQFYSNIARRMTNPPVPLCIESVYDAEG